MSALRESLGFLTSRLRQVGIFVALILIVLLFQVLTNGILLEPQNVSNLVVQNSYILILAIGMVMVIIAGHIDLSVGSVAGFIGAVAGVMIVQWGWPWWAAIPACLLVGALVGAWQGYWIAYVGIPAFIVTLAGMLIFRGPDPHHAEEPADHPLPRRTACTRAAASCPTFPGHLRARMAHGHPRRGRYGGHPVPGNQGTQSPHASSTLENEPMAWFAVKNGFIAVLMLIITFLLASYRGTPIVLVVLAVLVILYSALMNNSIFGRHTYAIGGNLHAAELSGIKTKRVTFRLFVNMGVLAALAGLVFTARLNSAQPAGGTGFELDSIAAAFIGGAAVTGRHRHGRRSHDRRPDHGRAQQRHVHPGPWNGLPAAHQGPGAPPRRRFRHLQQEPLGIRWRLVADQAVQVEDDTPGHRNGAEDHSRARGCRRKVAPGTSQRPASRLFCTAGCGPHCHHPRRQHTAITDSDNRQRQQTARFGCLPV